MTEPISSQEYRRNQRRVSSWVYHTAQLAYVNTPYPLEDTMEPSDSISNTGSYELRLYHGQPMMYPPYTYEGPQQQQQHPQYHQHPLNFNSYGGDPYSEPYQQPPRSPTYSHISSGSHYEGRSMIRRHSSATSSSIIPGGLAEAYVPTVSMSGPGSTLVNPSDQPSWAPYYGSRTTSYADGAHYAVHQTEFLQVPQPVYPIPFPPFETYIATTSPNTPPYVTDTRPLSSHSHHSPNRPHSSHSHGSAHSPRSPQSFAHSYQSPQASPTPISQPLTLQPSPVVVVSGYAQCVVVQPASGRRLSVIMG